MRCFFLGFTMSMIARKAPIFNEMLKTYPDREGI